MFRSKKLIIPVLIAVGGIIAYSLLFVDEKRAADVCRKVADKSFKEIHGRFPESDDFLDNQVIHNDWYPVFEECLDDAE